MMSLRTMRAGLVPARISLRIGGAVAAFTLAAAPLSAQIPGTSPTPMRGVAAAAAAGEASAIAGFYAARQARPLWLAPESGDAAMRLIELLKSADADGLDPDRYDIRRLEQALGDAWGGQARKVMRADRLLSQAFVSYARDLRKAPGIGMKYVDRELVPGSPSARWLLERAAAGPLEDHVDRMGWMHPFYGQLRNALASGRYADAAQRSVLQLNLERARSLPAGEHRYVIVNAAAQRLYMYEDGEVVDSMRVVVGKQKNPTPMLAAFIRYTSLNPYWNVPPDLTAERIAPNVVKEGLGYLTTHGYEVLSDWSDHPEQVDPATIDWAAVADGSLEVRVRQLPGPGNAMGRMKFMFPNDEGVYLHDTPDRQLLEEASRMFSGGCVRLEDAPRLARWLYGEALAPQGARAEQQVAIPELTPVYITYLTAVPSGSEIAYFDDVYGRDAARIAQLQGAGTVASR